MIAQPTNAVERPPSPGAPHRAQLPTPREHTLANGLRIIAFRQNTAGGAALPLITAQALIRGGAAAEGDAQAGLASLATQLLVHGTARMDSTEFAFATDAIGARIDASSGYDSLVIGVGATTPVFAQAFALFRDVVREPAFAQSEVVRVRTKAIDDLAFTYSNPSAVARLVAQRLAYGAGPYGHPVAGTASTLARIERNDVVEWYARSARPDAMTLVIGGDIDPDDAFALAERVFGDWTVPAQTLPALPVFSAVARPARCTIVDKPDAGRTAVVVGRVAIARRSPDIEAGIVTTAVFSGYSGRLNQEVRVKRGLSYGAGAQLSPRRDPGMFVASTLVDHTRLTEAVGVVLDTLRSLDDAPPTDAELTTRKATISGAFSRQIETIDGIAGSLGELALFDIPLDDLSRYLPRIEAITAADVQRFAQAYVRDPFVVVAGNASVFGDSLRAMFPDAITIPNGQLNLDAPDACAKA